MSGKLYQVQNGQKVDVTPRIAALTDVSSKADISLGNVNSSGAEVMAHAAMPSDQYIDLTLPASGGSIIAPADGWLFFSKLVTSAFQSVTLRTAWVTSVGVSSNASGEATVYSCIPVAKGAEVFVDYSAAGALGHFRFTYCNGSAPQP